MLQKIILAGICFIGLNEVVFTQHLFAVVDLETDLLATPALAPKPGTLFMYPERIKLQDGGFFNAERGIFFVPINREVNDSKVIALEIYRFKANDKADQGAPPVFFLHGGPSFSGLEGYLENSGTFEDRWLPFLDYTDVIVVSQRGIGSSKPNTIVETTLPLQPPDQPFDDALAEKRLKEILIREKATWEKLGVDLKGFTIIEAAADIDEVRKALGYRKIVLWGGSFGSHWGMAVMRYYPEIVARAIFRGMEGPDHTYDHPGHLWNVYKRVAEDAENSKVFKDRIPEGGLIKAIETVINRVDEKPFTLRSTDPNTGVSYNVLFDSSTIRRLARGYSSGLRGWPADVISMYEGDFTEAARQIVDRYLRPSRNYRTASYYMLDCGSGITATRLKAYDDDPATFILNRMNWGYRSGCTVWESDLGDAFRQNFKTDIPAVIVHGTWDTSTPYENALELVPFFTNSKFIPVIRGPHGSIRAALRESEQFTSGIMRFAATGDMSGLPDQVELKPRSWILPEHMKSKGN